MGDSQVSAAFVRELRRALRYLYDPHNLRKSPLIGLFEVDQQRDPPSALRRILVDGIEALKPGTDVPSQTEAWRIYRLLLRRHTEQFTQREVATELNLSVRHVRREEARALEALARYLWTHYSMESKWRNYEAAPPSEGESSPADVRTPSHEQEIEWLQASLPSEPTDVGEMIQVVLQTIDPLVQALNVHIACRIPKYLPHLAVQPATTRQALLSVLTRAIRCVPGGRVHVEAGTHDWYVRIHVTPVVDQAVSSSALGSGSEGLKMAQRLVELSGGSIELVPRDGGGQRCTARLVLPAVGQVPVLVIDDNADTLQLLSRYLSGSRYHFIGARDPEQALALARESAPQIIVLDIMLPEVDGWELLGRLREHPQTHGVPIIVCTILHEEQLAVALGAAAFISKPVSRRAFLSALDHQFELLARASG